MEEINRKQITLKEVFLYGANHHYNNLVKLIAYPLGVPLAFLLIRFTKIKPNGVTICSLMLGLSSAVLVFFNEFHLAALVYYLGHVGDFIDGILARSLNMTSALGKRLDLISDRTGLIFLSFFYIHYFVSTGQLDEFYLMFIFTLVFYFFDIFDQSKSVFDLMTTNRSIEPKISVKDPELWLKKLLTIKNWVPTRITTIFCIFVLAPITGRFELFYWIALFILSIDISRYGTNILKKGWFFLVKK
jgi:CDP-diacylglycerol--serine O-phosphatidyltransferase